ncbi:MAG: UDP-3-O-[3-hydroxymyristoyl] N-acetylglucosamine deacetylase [Planctomycetes bacterium]|nr:UDP-3-O-[3-hydroxymyristoyl] N-acetylglucosamine deacetylase [Planctomycetota bacterium]
MLDGPQHTIAKPFTLEGVGLHQGTASSVTIKPAPANAGFMFRRVDLPHQPEVALAIENLGEAKRRTQLQDGDALVHTTEHLIAGLYGSGIDNALIEIHGEEPPALDGSAREFAERTLAAGRVAQGVARKLIKPRASFRVGTKDEWIEVAPGTGGFEVVYHLDYNMDLVPVQTVVYAWSTDNFLEDIAPARTFCLEVEAKALQAAGFGRGANTKNTLVIGEEGVLDNELRFSDEYARHKILDLVGDFALLGARLDAKVTSWRGGHALNHQAVKRLLNE